MNNQMAVCRNSGAASPHNTIHWPDFNTGNHRTTCPQCGRDRARDKTLGVTMEADGSGVAHCFRCNYTDSFKSVESRRNLAALRPIQRPHAMPLWADAHAEQGATHKRSQLSDYGQGLWQSCSPINGTIGAAYLVARRCAMPPSGGHLRFHPALKHGPSGYVGPALVGLVTDALTGQAMSLHRTWVKADGNKAPIDPPRLMLGGHTKQGGVIRLWPDEAVEGRLAVGEGVETCLSLAHAFTPVWALVDAGNLAAFPVLSGVSDLLIAQDRDPAGEKAAQSCAKRWSLAGATVRITMQDANDLNDCVRGAA